MMKNPLFPLLFLLTACAGQQFQRHLPQPEFEDTVYHFGVVDTDNPVLRHKFKFTNTGDAPFVILASQGSCDCTYGEYEKRPILPGETSEVTVVYDGTHYSGVEFYETVRLVTNTCDIYLNIDGEIK